MNRIKRLYFFLVTCSLCLNSCTTIDLFEKSVSIPGHEWKNSFKPSFTFNLKDTVATYQLFLVLRHTDKYKYNNIYINLEAALPRQDTTIKIMRDLTLATNDKGWLGEGMDDIYEHRIKLGDPQTLKAGSYTFSMEQIMRDDPLEHVLNVGLRIEKK